MSVMKPLFCFYLLVLLILFSKISLPTSAHQAGVLDPNFRHHERQMSPKTKDFLPSCEAQKLRVYVRKRSGGGGSGGLATRGHSKMSSAIGKRPPFLHVFLCLNLFLGVVLS